MPILTGDDLKTYLGLGSGEKAARVDFIADGINAWASTRTARDWVQVVRPNEKYRGRGMKELVLKHYPVVSISALTVDAVTLDVTNPDVVDLINPTRGILMRTDGQLFTKSDKRNIVITYIGGPRTAPADLKLAMVDLAAWVFQTTGGRVSVGDSGSTAAFMNLLDKGVECLPLVKSMVENHSDVLG